MSNSSESHGSYDLNDAASALPMTQDYTALEAEYRNGRFVTHLQYQDWCARAADAIANLRRERDEARNAAKFQEHNWLQERDLKVTERHRLTVMLTTAEAEAATLRARLEAVEGAAAAVLADWDERMPDGPESFRSNAELGFSYWSPSASMVSSEAMSKLRAALEGGDNA